MTSDVKNMSNQKQRQRNRNQPPSIPCPPERQQTQYYTLDIQQRTQKTLPTYQQDSDEKDGMTEPSLTNAIRHG